MPGFALETFEPRAEAFAQARAWRELQFLTGRRPGRGLVSLYEEDFPELTSTDFWADLQTATAADPRQHARLSALVAAAEMEGRTRDIPVRLTRLEAGASIAFEDAEIPWREAPARWSLIEDVPRRHELEEAWRHVFRVEVVPVLTHWQEHLRTELRALGADDWVGFWSNLYGYDNAPAAKLAQSVLDGTAELYGNSLGVYLGQLGLPLDDLWVSDIDRAFRAPRFDGVFSEMKRIPITIRALRDLGIELEDQTAVQVEYVATPGVTILPLEVPSDVRVLLRLEGGWQDFARTLQGLGMAEHLAHADPSLRFWERWLGDTTPTSGYGLLLEGLLRDHTWLLSRVDYAGSDDFRVISHLSWLYRVRKTAALARYEQRLWLAEPGGSMSAEYADTLTAATRVRHFADDYLAVLLGAPWTTLRYTSLLRAEIFAAQLRAFLQREFDEEWWRASRAANFIEDELWRPARRHSAEELLGFMGYEGFDTAPLVAEFEQVLQPL